MLDTVKVPREMELIFQKAQGYVSKYFKNKKYDPSKGSIEIFNERYILVRAASMAVDFFEVVKGLYKDSGEEEALNVARQLLFDIAHTIGKQDAKNFHKKMKLKDPIEKLSAGPIHFSHSGWAFVDIFPESKPSPDENFYLIYDHPFSFESDSWKKAGKKSNFPVCIMNAGYSSGWCEESFCVSLVASEIMCRVKGDDVCRFIMAHPSRIEGYIKDYVKKEPGLAKRITKYEVPGFFKRKQIEEDRKKMNDMLKESEQKFKAVFDNAVDGILIVDVENKKFHSWNKAICQMLGYSEDEIKNLGVAEIHPKESLPYVTGQFEKQLKREVTLAKDIPVKTKDGSVFYADINSTPIELFGKTYLVGVFRDITERNKVESELKKKIHDLEVFQKAAVDRELRMVELKDKIKVLEAKLKEKDSLK